MAIVFSGITFFLSCGEPATEYPFYISPDGDDSATGTSPKRPFASIGRAQRAVRELAASGTLDKPVTVYIMGGYWELDTPIVFTPEDSGTSDLPVTWRGWGNTRPVISGGRHITGWTERADGMWTTVVPGVSEGWWFRQLFVNGERRTRARTPDTGEYFHVNGKLTTDDPAVLPYRDNNIDPGWAEKGDAELVSLNKWTEFKLIIKRLDTEKKTAVLSQKFHPWIIEENARYWVENIPDACDNPGEWYLDFDSGELVYYPLPGEDMNTAEVIAPRLTELLRFEGDPEESRYVTNLVISGIDFVYTDWTMPRFDGYIDSQAASEIPGIIHGDGARNITIRFCTLAHHGRYAIDFSRGCAHNTIQRNQIFDIGAGGVRIGETIDREDEKEQTYGNLITDNHIHHIGEVYPQACGVIIFRSAENTIAHNEIHDTYYTGISNGWSWGYKETNTHHSTIEYNHVYNIGRGMLSDMGGNYNLGLQPGSVVRNNVFHDISSSGYGGWGMYTDEGSTYILFENNVVYNTKTGGFHQHYGRDNIIRNNIFAFSTEKGQIIRSRGEAHLSFRFEHNIIYWTKAPLLGGNWGTTLNIYNTDDSLVKATDTTTQYFLDSNCYWKTGGEPIDFMGLTFEEWHARGQDVHSIIADPLFVDPLKGDFRLGEGSPALSIGFKPIDTSKVGPRE